MSKLEIDAKIENIEKINDYIAANLMGCPMKLLMQIDLVAEKIFTNIINYAYKDSSGKVCISCTVDNDENTLRLVFANKGIPFNPIEAEAADITSDTDEGETDSHGIFLTKRLMDDIKYENKNGENILTIVKKF